MAWWGWLLIGWLPLSIAGGLFIGALAATARERDRRTGTGSPPD